MSLVTWLLFREGSADIQEMDAGDSDCACVLVGPQDNLIALQMHTRTCTHKHRVPSFMRHARGLRNMGAIKHHPFLSAADFLRERKKKDTQRSLGKLSLMRQEVILLSVFICGLPISFLSNTLTLLVALTGHVNTHTDHT